MLNKMAEAKTNFEEDKNIRDWVETKLARWLEKYYSIKLKILDFGEGGYTLELDYKGKINKATISKEDIEDIKFANNISKVNNKENINHIYKILDTQFVTFISSSEEANLNLPTKLSIFTDKDKKSKVDINLDS